MNKEQAVKYLSFSGFSDEQIKAIEGAFTCEDAISREAVLKIYDEWFANCNIADKKESPKSKIKALPPVTPQPKMGHWIFVDKAKEHARCSECGYGDVDLFNGKPHNYCEKCGVKMVEPQESEEV